MIGHLWSLSVEEQFYLLWPSALRRLYRHKVSLLLSVVAIGPIVGAFCRHFRLPLISLASFPAVADTLAIGCLLAIFGSKLPRIRTWMALVMLLVVILSPYYAGDTRLKSVFELFVLWPAVNCCMAGLLLHVVQTPYRFLNIAPVVWLGRISYSLYLWQQPFFLAPPGQPAYRLLFGIGLACLSYYLVEQPVLRLREKRAACLNNIAVAADVTQVPCEPARA
jgi:peptidoglycan/LPS O-acetylase OafA/YrhL